MIKNFKRNAAAIAVNTVVMMIIGLVIFGLGMGLFSRISGSADDQLSGLQDEVRSDIASLECKGDDWVCVPSYKMKNGGEEVYQVFIANQGQTMEKFKIELALDDFDGVRGIDKSSTCGKLVISYLESLEVNVKSGYSASLPFIVKATRVSDTPCSFVTTVSLKKVSDGSEVDRASVIVRVE